MALLSLGVTPPALAQDAAPLPACELPLSDLRTMLARGNDALLEDDLAAVQALQDDLRRQIPCVDRVVPADDWAAHLVTLAIAAYYANDDWQTPLTSALAAAPTVDRRVPSTHVIARWSPPGIAGGGDVRAIPPDVSVWLDGRRITYAAPLRGPHLVQVKVDDQLRSVLVEGAGNTAIWDELLPVASPPPDAPQSVPALPAVVEDDRPRATGWLVAGGGLALVGAGVGVGTWGMRSQGDDDEQLQTPLVVGNTIGWGLAAVGGGLFTVGVVRTLDSDLRIGLGPRSVRLSGSFR